MAKFLTRKVLFLRLILPVLVSVLPPLVLYGFLKGPVLGKEFDYLCGKRPPPPVASEILIISMEKRDGFSGENIISPAIACSVMETLTEMSAAGLIIQTPVLGTSSSGLQSSAEIIYLFDEEFAIINGNIKNLFDGIKTGSIEPAEAEDFVSEVISLNEAGKERLLHSAFRTNEAELEELEKVFQVFGKAYIQRGVELSVISHKNEGSAGAPKISSLYSSTYSEGVRDRDGKVRRVVPFVIIDAVKNISKEHIAYAALRNRFPEKEMAFNPDENGALIFENPAAGAGGRQSSFRELPLSLFLEYYDLDKTLYKLLSESVSLAGYGGILPDRYPPFLYENAEKIQNGIFSGAPDAGPEKEQDEEPEGEASPPLQPPAASSASPSPGGLPPPKTPGILKEDWIAAREEYFSSLEQFFSGVVEEDINSSFNKVIEEETAANKLSEAGIGKFTALRDGELQKYLVAKEVYEELRKVRRRLETNLADSFCILGETDIDGGALKSADISALLANSLLTGNSIKTEPEGGVMLYSLAAPAAAAAAVFLLPPVLSFVTGLLAAAGVYLLFAQRFILTGTWLDPVIPASAALCAVIISCIIAAIARASMSSFVKRSFGGIVSRDKLRRLIRTRRALPENYKTVPRSTVVAVFNPNFKSMENNVNPLFAAKFYEKFINEVADVFAGEGALIIPGTQDTVLAVFDSPLDELVGNTQSRYNSAARAARIILTLPGGAKTWPWFFGLDCGECTYFRPPSGGYTARGKVIDRAIEMAALCSGHKVQAIAGKAASLRLKTFSLRPLTPPPDENSENAFFGLGLL